MAANHRRPSLPKIDEHSSEGMSARSRPETSARSSSATALLLEIEKLKSDVEMLRASNTASCETGRRSGAPGTLSQTRLQLEALKKQLGEMKLDRTAERRRTAIKSREVEIQHLIETAQTLDLAFLFDATASMQSCINEVKETITKIAEAIGRAYPRANLRVGFAVYRDYEDELDHAEKCDFTSSFKGSDNTFVRALSRVIARGGADDAEDVFTGLEQAASLSWNATNRVLFHIADSPCHGTQFHSSAVQDNYPNGDKLGRNIGQLLQRLRDESQITVYFFCHLNDFTKEMIQEFRNVAAGKGDWIHEQLFEDVRKIPHCVASVCTETISNTLSTVGKGKPTFTKYVPCDVKPAIPTWSKISAHTGYLLEHKPYCSLDELLMKINSEKSLDLKESMSVQVQIAHHPFSNEGATRWPYYALVWDRYEETLMVAKRFKSPLGEDTRQVHAPEKYMAQMEVQTVSAKLAEEFNKTTSALGQSKQVIFCPVSTLRTGSCVYNLEKKLDGNWKKYSNNGGYVNTHEYAATLQAFSHWTHERSRGALMVTDLQGVQIQTAEGKMEFVLSDPAIHCIDLLRFTSTNLGALGFQLFYNSHLCNDVCHKLRLKASPNGCTTEGTQLR